MLDMMSSGPYGGYLTYTPRFKLPEHQLMELRDALVDSMLIEEAENGEIRIDWFINNGDGPPYHTREGVLLYRDGGDSEIPAVLYYRSGGNPSHMPASVHIPPAEEQAALSAASSNLWTTRDGDAVEVLGGYLNRVVNDAAAWTPLTFTNEYEGFA